MRLPSYEQIMHHARDAADLGTLAYAGIIGQALREERRPLIRELAEDRFQRLLERFFPGLELANGGSGVTDARLDEFDDLLQLLLEHRAAASEEAAWLCHAIASASMGDNHLWQDMGLPHRQALSELMARNFPGLKAKNAGDMKWKKFFYRQLCERAEVLICKSPSCAVCTDYKVCFAPEEGEAKVPSIAIVPLRAAVQTPRARAMLASARPLSGDCIMGNLMTR